MREEGSRRWIWQRYWHVGQDVSVSQEVPAPCAECRELLLRYLTRCMCPLLQDFPQWQLVSHLAPLFMR